MFPGDIYEAIAKYRRNVVNIGEIYRPGAIFSSSVIDLLILSFMCVM